MWAADNGVNVLNLSLSIPEFSVGVHNAIGYAYRSGVLVVTSVANDGATTPTYPAADSNVLSVGSLAPDDQRAWFSNYGQSWVDMAAAGIGVVSTMPTYPVVMDQWVRMLPGGLYASGDGASVSAPIVTGVAAAIWPLVTDANANGTKADDVANRLMQTSDVLPGTGTAWRSGRPNLCRALTLAPTCGAAPSSTPPPAASDVPGSTTAAAPTAAPRAGIVPGRYRGRTGAGRSLRFTANASGLGLRRFVTRLALSCRHASRYDDLVSGSSSFSVEIVQAGGGFTVSFSLRDRHLASGTLTVRGRIRPGGRASGTLSAFARGRRAGRLGRCRMDPTSWSARVA